MTENIDGGPSLIKLGKLANSRDFDKLEALWPEALANQEYTWRELVPIAGQVGRQKAVDRAETLMALLVERVEEKSGPKTALLAVRAAAAQLPTGSSLRSKMTRLYTQEYSDFAELPQLLDLLLPEKGDLGDAVNKIELYIQLQVGHFAADRHYLVPGIVEEVDGATGGLALRFEDRKATYDVNTVAKLKPRPMDYFPALAIYAPDHLVELAGDDPVEFVKMALRSTRENRLNYRELKGHITGLLGEKGWKSWWTSAKPALKRDPHISMTPGSQPTFRLLRQADQYEDRLRRKFDLAKTPMAKLQKVMEYLDEINREEKRKAGSDAADEDLLVHFGNGSAKVAVSVLNDEPALALAGLALHAEVAARGAAVARPNPRAAGQVLAKIGDPSTLNALLPDALLQRVLHYLREALPDRWGTVWAAVLLRSGRRLCDQITRVLIEEKQTEALESALNQAVERPTSSPELLGWLWRTRFTSAAAGQFLVQLESLPVSRIADAMFAMLDSLGTLYGMSLEDKHLKGLESARAALATQNNRPLLGLLDDADRTEAARLKAIFEKNAGLSPAQRTQLLGYLRSKYADLFLEITREWEEGGIIYTTEDGLRRQQDILNHIIREEIPQVAKQIGEAASFGDLSENSEYTAALEARDQLASRATGLENELSVAKVINHEMAGSDFVNVGTRVHTEDTATGQEEVFTFLGPWDTDVENRILNYQAPLAMKFMGLKVGDEAVFGEGIERRSWKILGIEPAI